MAKYDTDLINSLFFSNLEADDTIEKRAQDSTYFIREKVLEHGFVDKILPPQLKSRSELQVSTTEDTYYDVIGKRKKFASAPAYGINYLGEAGDYYEKGTKYEVRFQKIETETFRKDKDEVLAMKIPLTQILEEEFVYFLEEIRDGHFVTACRAVINANPAQRVISASTTILQANLENLKASMRSLELYPAWFVMTENTFGAVNNWTNLDSELLKEVIIEGFKYNSLLGVPVIRTLKETIVKEKEVWCFPTAEFLGTNELLDEVQFWMKYEKNILEMMAWESRGTTIGNSYGVHQLTLV